MPRDVTADLRRLELEQERGRLDAERLLLSRTINSAEARLAELRENMPVPDEPERAVALWLRLVGHSTEETARLARAWEDLRRRMAVVEAELAGIPAAGGKLEDAFRAMRDDTFALTVRHREVDARSFADAVVRELERMPPPVPKRIVSTVTGALNARLRGHRRGGRRESRSRSRAAHASRDGPSDPSPEHLAPDEALLRSALAELLAARVALEGPERRLYVLEHSLAALLERRGDGL